MPWTYRVFLWSWPETDFSAVDVIVDSGRASRSGVTPFLIPPFWMDQRPLSSMNFVSERGGGPDHRSRADLESWGATQVQRRNLRPKDMSLTCWQYQSPYTYGIGPGNGFRWSVDCEMSGAASRHSFRAHFAGLERDLPAFYRILEGVEPVRE
jgi:hypothetical protein